MFHTSSWKTFRACNFAVVWPARLNSNSFKRFDSYKFGPAAQVPDSTLIILLLFYVKQPLLYFFKQPLLYFIKRLSFLKALCKIIIPPVNFRSSSISFFSIFGALSQLMNLLGSVSLKASSGTSVIAVLSQMTPDNVRSIRICLPSFVKLPAWSLWVKKKRSPFLDLKNCLSKMMKRLCIVILHLLPYNVLSHCQRMMKKRWTSILNSTDNGKLFYKLLKVTSYP